MPLNFRYAPDEIEYCLNLAEVDVLVFGPEFIGRVEEIADKISQNRLLFYVGGDCPSFAEDYDKLTANCASLAPGTQFLTKMMRQFIFLPEQPDFRKQFYIIMKV